MNVVSVTSTVGILPSGLHRLTTKLWICKTHNSVCGDLQSTCNSLFYFMFHLIQTIVCFDSKYNKEVGNHLFLVYGFTFIDGI